MNLQIRKRLLLISAAAILTLVATPPSCSKGPDTEGPIHQGARLSVKPEKADFGEIQSNDPVAFHAVTLTLSNHGKERIEIERIELPDGFSYTIVPRMSIGGGGKTTLRITMDRRKFSGEVAETAYVLSEDPVEPRLPIPMTASIVGDTEAPPEGGPEGPDIVLDHRAHRFGTLTRSDVVEHTFPIRNAGNETLKIHYIETNCICATAYATKYELRPGESAEIIVKLEAYKYPGNNPVKTLLLATNDPDEPAVGLTLIATIVDVARVEPREILLPDVPLGQPTSAEARVIQDGAEDLIIKEIQISSPMISVETLPLTGDQKGYRLDITIGPEMSEGKFEELLTIVTNYTNYAHKTRSIGPGGELYQDYKRLQLPIKGAVKGSISITPSSVNFGSASAGEPVRRKIVISSAKPIEIESVTATDPAIHVSYERVEPGNRYEITVELRPDHTQRQIADNLVIKTKEKELSVPVFATIKPGS